MRKFIICLFLIFPMFISCQNRWQIVEYKGVSVQIPSNWGSKNTINNYKEEDDDDLTEYQISCWSKDKTNHSLAIQWLDVELESSLYIESMIEIQKERFPIYSVCKKTHNSQMYN